MNIADVMALAPVIPVLVVDDVALARPLAEALVEGGLFALEVTLRTAAALDVIAAMASVPGAVVGAGTVLDAAELDRAIDAGARFIVSPGLTEPLARAAIASGLPYLPGIATAADIMRGYDLGLSHFKFFPAASSGGIAGLAALAAPFQAARFCPTGGVSAATAPAWLELESVLCVGGSWLFRPGEHDWAATARTARAASTLGRRAT